MAEEAIDPNLSVDGMTVQIDYDDYEFAPLAMDSLGALGSDGQWVYEYPAPGGSEALLRLWTTNAGERNPQPVWVEGGQYVPSGTYLASDLGLTSECHEVTLYVEGLAQGTAPIAVTVTSAREYLTETEPISDTDTVLVTVVDVDVEVNVDSNNDGHVNGADAAGEEKPPGKLIAVGAGQRASVVLSTALGSFDPSEFTFTLDYDDATIRLYTVGAAAYDPANPEAGYLAPGEITAATPVTISDLLGGKSVYMDGVALGATDITLTATKTTGAYAGEDFADKARVSVVLDLDTDSDNNGSINGDADEDRIEDNDADSLGKRIFVNWDDDNKNGRVDVWDRYYEDNDLAEIKLDFSYGDMADLAGYELWLSFPYTLEIYASSDKKTVYPPATPTPQDNGTRDYDTPRVETTTGGGVRYKWTLAPGVDLPETLWVEGKGPGRYDEGTQETETFDVSWRLVKPTTGAILARDTVNIRVEQIVWPNQDPSAGWNPQANTETWNGFELPAGWFMSSSLCQIIHGDVGYIRTEYPMETSPGRWEGTTAQNSNAALDLAKLCNTETWDDNVTIRIELEYDFEQSPNITVGQFVDTTYAKYKEGFFHNSGVKIENRAEIQVFDTASLLDAIKGVEDDKRNHAIIEGNSVTLSADPSNDIEQTKKVLLQHTGSQSGDWMAEDVNGLISGIPYLKVDEVESGPLHVYDTYMEWLEKAPMGGQTMFIDVLRDEYGTYDFIVTIGGHTRTYANIPGSGTSDPGMLYLQSHWGGGVKFTIAKVKKL